MKYFIAFISFFIPLYVSAQPGWQQHVDTKIEVRLDDKKHMLYGHEELTYTNNSPDTLKYIYLHLWMNAFKNDRTPYARQQDVNGGTTFYYSKPKDRGYIDSLVFTVNGENAEHYSTEDAPDIARLDLRNPLYPGQTVKIATPFRVKIPIVFSRPGHTDQAYYISQWFPKPAVYDRKGWHPISYLDQGEFFSEYGSYDVSITLPANYVVMATGNCIDDNENKWMDELAAKAIPNTTAKIFVKHNDTIPPSAAELKTVRYHEDNVHDFAWFADKRWLVQKDTVYSPGTGQLVTTWAAFLPSYIAWWKDANKYLKETVKHYGKWVGPYQYKTIKAVLGDLHAGGGMEYPTVTVIDKKSKNLETVVVHEAGHNWFYGMLGSNERDHAWMDEGLNTFYEQKTNEATDTSHKKVKGKKVDESILYYQMAATHNDQAIDQTSANFTKLNYGLDVYYKSTLMLKWLEEYMGPADFSKGMHDYYDNWHFHHPYPEDFRKCMQNYTSKSLDWFFDEILKTEKKIDFKIIKAKTNGNNTDVTIRNNTGVKAPVLIGSYSKDSLQNRVWSEPFTGSTTLSVPGTSWTQMKVDEVIADGKPANNVYRKKALFHHFGLKFNPVAGLNIANKDKIFIAPAYAHNHYDGIMLGLLFHNITVPENRFRFAVAPLFAFGSRTLNGAGSVGYVWYPHGIFKDIMLQADAKSFHNNETFVNVPDRLYTRFLKVAPSLEFTFKEKSPLSHSTRTLLLKQYNITEETINFGTLPTDVPRLVTAQNMYGLIRYRHVNERTYNPFNYSLEAHGNGDFAKLSAEANLRIDYNVKNKALLVRGYAGKYLAFNNAAAVTSRYQLNSSFGGENDYLYDGTYRGRNATNGLAAQQISIQEGGFKIPVHSGVYRSDNWMAAVNLKTDLPKINVPVRLFFDAGLIPNATPSFKNSSSTKLLYEGGVEVFLSKDIISFYFPIIMSGDFRDYLTNNYGKKNVFARSISFTVQLQNINWLKLPTRLLKTVVN